MKLWQIIAGAAVGSYLLDVPLRRAAAASAARAYANARGLPLLNVGAGTGETALFGSTLYGDVNTDLNGRRDVPHGTPGVVTYANAEDLSAFSAGAFGAVLASHILEHLPHPGRAISEWLRVVGGDRNALFVVTPNWWAPHTWLHAGHLWYFPDGEGCLTGCSPRRLDGGIAGATPLAGKLLK
jgi:ubiquinone/menaquinone biosynthesis C-methylase UbiE